MYFEVELPEDFSTALAKWQEWSESQ